MYTYTWNIRRSWPTWTAYIYEGRIQGGTYHKVWSGEFLRRKTAERELVKALQRDMDRNEVWRNGEGGRSLVANNWAIKPWIRGLKSPDGKPAKPYDFWPESWGPEPSEEEYARKSQLGYYN